MTIVATDAIDHSVLVPGGPDLRSANFEMIGIADVDNPSVPDMIDITEGGTISPHGINWPESGAVTVLALPLNAAALQRAQVQEDGYVFARIPHDRVLDLLSFHSTYAAPYPNCPSMVHANFDRAMAFLLLGDEYGLSRQRHVTLISPAGRKIAQHSRSSDADFVAATRSPGVLP